MTDNKVILIMSQFPGSGKTYLANKLVKKYELVKKKAVIINICDLTLQKINNNIKSNIVSIIDGFYDLLVNSLTRIPDIKLVIISMIPVCFDFKDHSKDRFPLFASTPPYFKKCNIIDNVFYDVNTKSIFSVKCKVFGRNIICSNNIEYDPRIISLSTIQGRHDWIRDFKPNYFYGTHDIDLVEILEAKYMLIKRFDLVKELIDIIMKIFYSTYSFI